MGGGCAHTTPGKRPVREFWSAVLEEEKERGSGRPREGVHQQRQGGHKILKEVSDASSLRCSRKC